MGLPSTKNLHRKRNINKMIKQPMEWGKTLANHICGNGLISKIYREFMQLNRQTTATTTTTQYDYKMGKGAE